VRKELGGGTRACLSATSPASKQAPLTLTLPDGREWVRPNREVDRGRQYSTANNTAQHSTKLGVRQRKTPIDSTITRAGRCCLWRMCQDTRTVRYGNSSGVRVLGHYSRLYSGLSDEKPSGGLWLRGLSEPKSTATLSVTATNSKSFAGPNVPFLYTNIFSFASVHWGRGCGGVPDGAPDGACGRVNRSRSHQG
jgi:hypothetical protein